jgi:hypothetical protein
MNNVTSTQPVAAPPSLQQLIVALKSIPMTATARGRIDTLLAQALSEKAAAQTTKEQNESTEQP